MALALVGGDTPNTLDEINKVIQGAEDKFIRRYKNKTMTVTRFDPRKHGEFRDVSGEIRLAKKADKQTKKAAKKAAKKGGESDEFID